MSFLISLFAVLIVACVGIGMVIGTYIGERRQESRRIQVDSWLLHEQAD